MDHLTNDKLDLKKIQSAWEQFVEGGPLPLETVREEVLQSWQRSRAYGIDPYLEIIQPVFSSEEKEHRLSEGAHLIKTARPFLMGLFDVIRSIDAAVFLTDRDGFILDALGDGIIWEYVQSKNAVVGSSFHERYVGTNAPFLALHLDRPCQLTGAEHYAAEAHLATCAAAPIHDETGNLVGSLDLTASYETAFEHPHTLGMIVAGAQVIENQIRLKAESEKTFLANRYLKAALETMSTGVVVLDRDKRVTHINPAAEKILGISLSTVQDRHIARIIRNESITDAIREMREIRDQEILLQESITRTRCLVNYKPIATPIGKRLGSVLFIKEMRLVQELVQKVVGLQAPYTFQDIIGGSRAIKETIQLAETMAGGRGNVMIMGESGTGKEMLAQSIHNAGRNAAGPFLAINTAAIPRDLIESELFGYESGTFTGSSRGGKSGKFELAAGGTLFLDEINGMSLDMQAKLLRVLEEKKYLRLGGKSYLHLNARILAATNVDLQREIEKGNFRGDLYYRLNVLEIKVPPLRERPGDIQILAERFVAEIGNSLGKKIEGLAPDALDYLGRQTFPGNVRQLKNWIERAVHLSQGPLLRREDFPDPARPAVRTGSSKPDASPGTKENRLQDVEKDVIQAALTEFQGNVSRTASRLGIGRTTLYRKLKKYHISISRQLTVETPER